MKKNKTGDSKESKNTTKLTIEKNEALKEQALKQKKLARLFMGLGAACMVLGLGALAYAFIGNSGDEVLAESNSEIVEASSEYAEIRSSLGFAITYNHKIDDATASTASDSRTINETLPDEGPVEWKDRDYNFVSIRPDFRIVDEETVLANEYRYDASALYISATSSNLFLDFAQRQAEEQNLELLDFLEQSRAEKSSEIEGFKRTVEKVNSEDTKIGEYDYRVATYKVTTESENIFEDGVINTREHQTLHYITIQNNQVYQVTVDNLESGISDLARQRYDAYVQSIAYSEPDEGVLTGALDDPFSPANFLSSSSAARESLTANIDQVAFFGGTAYAQEESSSDSSGIVSENEPATVRILAGYCVESTLTSPYASITTPVVCSAGQGTGFIISGDGYLASNGHVTDKDVAHVHADLIGLGNTNVIAAYVQLLTPSRLSDDVLAATATSIARDPASRQQFQLGIRYGDTGSTKITSTVVSDKKHYAVQLGTSPASFTLSFDREKALNGDIFEGGDGIVSATYVASDYNLQDPYTESFSDPKYTSSDVAILKLPGGVAYPFVELGSIDSISNGSSITVIGYPGAIEGNSLTDGAEVLPTATRGIVSNVREDSGGDRKLIQSDVGIDSGNSGGPGFNENGEVVGLATYGLLAGSGGSTFNYLRDVADLKALVESNGLNLQLSSSTQDAWESALDNYSNRYFSDAISDLEKTLEGYPSHPTAQKLIEKSQTRIANGEEATKLTAYVPAAFGVMFLGLGGTGSALFFNKKHKHQMVASGYAPQQMVQQYSPQQVQQIQAAYTQPQPQAVAPVQQQPMTPQSPPTPGQQVAQSQQPRAITSPQQTVTPQQPAAVVQPPVAEPQPDQPQQPQAPQQQQNVQQPTSPENPTNPPGSPQS